MYRRNPKPLSLKEIVWTIIGVALFVLVVLAGLELLRKPDPAAVARAALVVLGLVIHLVHRSWIPVPEPPPRYPRNPSRLDRLPLYLDSLAEEQLAILDASILEGNIRGALQLVEAYCGITLSDAAKILWQRYQQLRAARPRQFVCNDDQWRSQLLVTLDELEKDTGTLEK